MGDLGGLTYWLYPLDYPQLLHDPLADLILQHIIATLKLTGAKRREWGNDL